MAKRAILSLIVGACFSVVTLYFAFRNVPLADLLNYLGTVDYLWIVPSVTVVLAAFALRALRWQMIIGADRALGFWRAFHPLMIGFMINCILPGRVGELARPAVLQRRDQVPFATGIATVAAERVFDLVMLLIFLVAVLALVDIDPDASLTFGRYQLNRQTLMALGKAMFNLSVVLVAGIVLVSVHPVRRMIQAGLRAAPRALFFAGDAFKAGFDRRVIEPLVRLTDNIARGFALIRQPGRLLGCLGLSVAVWLLNAASYYILAQGSPGIDLDFAQMTAVMVIVCFFIALPSVPGFWGLWEAGGVFALSLFGVTGPEAAGFTLANHAVQMFPVIIVGLVSAMVTGINIAQVALDRRR